MTIRRTTAGLLLFAFCLASPFQALANLNIMPLGVEFGPGEQAQQLWLTNRSDQPLRVQLRLFNWSQVDGEDVLEPSHELVVSPPLLEVAPHQRQLVRVIAPPHARKNIPEQSYRLWIDELPNPDSEQATGLNFSLRYSLPIFIANQVSSQQVQSLAWQLVAEGDSVTLKVLNSGGSRVKVSDLTVLDIRDQPLFAKRGLMGYVLAESARSWPLKLEHGNSAAARIRATINGVTQQFTLAEQTALH